MKVVLFLGGEGKRGLQTKTIFRRRGKSFKRVDEVLRCDDSSVDTTKKS